MAERAVDEQLRTAARLRRAGTLALAIAALALAGAGCGDDDDGGNGGATAPPPVQTDGGGTATQEEPPATQTETQPEGGGNGGAPAGDPQAGAEVFATNCATCHGSTGAGAATGPSLQRAELADSPDAVRAQVVNGGGGMPPFGEQLSDQEIADVVAYVTEDLAQR